MKVLFALYLAWALCDASPAPQAEWVPTKEITKYGTDEVILVNEDNIDINGCVVGPDGSRNCPNGAFGSSGDKVTFRGNVGHRNTGSNGNAGPLDAQGLPTDPAAVTYLKQLEAYKIWEQQQEANNRRLAGLGAPEPAAAPDAPRPVLVQRRRPAVVVRRRLPAGARQPAPVAQEAPIVVAVVDEAPPSREAVLAAEGQGLPLEAVDRVGVAPTDFVAADGCTYGPSGQRVCPQGAFGSAGDATTFRGNVGHRNTGSNGNAGPIDENGIAYDPAARTYLKQLEAYKLWEKQQEENNKRIIG